MILSAQTQGDGPTLVFLHGLFGSARNLGALQRHFAKHYRTIALDLRNHGASPHDALMDYPVMAADVVETLIALDALPASLFGHSMGGKTAMMLALNEPRSIRSLIVADIAPAAYQHGNASIAAALASLDLSRPLTRAEADRALATSLPDAAVRSFLLQNFVAGDRPSWRTGLGEIAAAMPAIEGWPRLAARYEGPVLFLAGDRSDYVTQAAAPAITALFPAATIERIAGAGHWLHADNPAAVIAATEMFLANSA